MRYLILLIFSFVFSEASTFIDSKKVSNLYYKSSNESETIHNVIKNKKWKFAKDKINLGFVDNPYWIKIKVNNQDKNKKYLFVHSYLIDTVDIFIVKNNNVIQSYQAGIRNTIENRNINFRKPTVDIEKLKNVDIYIKMKSYLYPLNISFNLLSHKDFTKIQAYDNVIHAVYFFILIIMILYNFILMLLTKINYLYNYIVYLVSLFFTGLYTTGILQQLIFTGGISNITAFIFQVIGIIMLFSLLHLISNLLNLNNKSKKIFYSLLIIMMVLFLLNWSLIFLFDYSYSLLLHSTHFITMCAILFVSFFIFKRTLKFDLFAFLISLIWLPLSIVILIFLYNQLYLFISPIFLEFMVKLVFIYETIFISLLLAYKIKMIETEKSKISLQLKEKENELIRSEKLISMGEMLNNIAHQWKQPLARINSIIFKSYNLLENKKIELLKKDLLLIENETSYMADTISGLLSFFHKNKKLEKINLYDIAKDQKNFIEKLNKQVQVKIKCVDTSLETFGYKKEYIQVVRVIIENSLDFFTEQKIDNPLIIISIKRDFDTVIFSIENNKSKIEMEDINKVFEPYFTTKNKQLHQGIGLYMSKILVEESMKKTLEVWNTQVGVRFTIKG